MLSKWTKGNTLISSCLAQLDSLLQTKNHQNGNIVGIDFGFANLKLLKINCTKTPYKVEKFAIAPFPQQALNKDGISDYPLVATALKQMFDNANVSTRQVAFAIPRSKAILKTITVDGRLTADELESRAWIEAGRHFPDLVGDIYLDFFITQTQDPSQVDLTLVACRKTQVAPYLEILRLAGLQPKVIDVDSYALERAMPLITEPNTAEITALLCINTTNTTLTVTQNGQLIYAHDQSFDGQRLLAQTQAYLTNKNILPQQAEYALINDTVYEDILKDNFISHLRHTMHFFYASRPQQHIQKLILGGDCATIPHLVPFIHNELGLTATTANFSAQLVLEPDIPAETFKSHTPALLLCCGLALSKPEV